MSQEFEGGSYTATDATAGIKVQYRYWLGSELVSAPYRATSPAIMSAVEEQGFGWTLTQRDTMGRVKSVETVAGKAVPSTWPLLPGAATGSTGITMMTYGANTIQRSDPMGRVSIQTFDALGRMTSASDGATSSLYTVDGGGM